MKLLSGVWYCPCCSRCGLDQRWRWKVGCHIAAVVFGCVVVRSAWLFLLDSFGLLLFLQCTVLFLFFSCLEFVSFVCFVVIECLECYVPSPGQFVFMIIVMYIFFIFWFLPLWKYVVFLVLRNCNFCQLCKGSSFFFSFLSISLFIFLFLLWKYVVVLMLRICKVCKVLNFLFPCIRYCIFPFLKSSSS